MDTVFFIINGQEVYVADYYKNEVKAITFKDKDFWEVYDTFDFQELIEYMNYPLHYKRFKGSKVIILYTEPSYYEMLFDNKKHFEQAEALETGRLTEGLKHYCEKKDHFGHRESYYITYEDTIYQVVQDEHVGVSVIRCTIEMLNDIEDDEKFDKINTVELCTHLIEESLDFLPFQDHLLVLSPAYLEEKYIEADKQSFLETHFVIHEDSIKANGFIQKGENIFIYSQHVHTIFGRKKKQVLEKKAAATGYFYGVITDDTKQNGVWAQKGQLIGVITKEEQTENRIKEWLKKIGI